MSKKQIYFRNDWLSNPDFKSRLRHRDCKTAFCDKCNKTIELSNMDEQALTSHMKSKKTFEKYEINKLFRPTT